MSTNICSWQVAKASTYSEQILWHVTCKFAKLTPPPFSLNIITALHHNQLITNSKCQLVSVLCSVVKCCINSSAGLSHLHFNICNHAKIQQILPQKQNFSTLWINLSTYKKYCKTLFFCRILILQFPYVENLLHWNFADFPVNFIKQFPVSLGASN